MRTDVLAARAVLGRSRALLLDFDGPVARVFADLDRAGLAGELRTACRDLGDPLPDQVADTGDPMAALAWSVGRPRPVRLAVDAVVRRHELVGARRAAPTPGLDVLLADARAAGVPVAVVTNNCAQVVGVLVRRAVPALVGVPVAGRVAGRPEELKPAPVLVWRALETLGAEADAAVLIGDSVTDVAAARAAGVAVVALVLRPAKQAVLAAAGPDGWVDSLGQLAHVWGGAAPAGPVP